VLKTPLQSGTIERKTNNLDDDEKKNHHTIKLGEIVTIMLNHLFGIYSK